MAELDTFAYRVELLRRESGVQVAGVFFAKRAFELGAVKAAADAAIRTAICIDTQHHDSFTVDFERYDTGRERRLRDATFMLCSERATTTETSHLEIREIPPAHGHGQ
jgi:hypothetical protein